MILLPFSRIYMVSNPKHCKSWPHAGWQNRWLGGDFSSFSWFWLAGCHPIFHWNKKSTDHFGQQSMLNWRLHRESNPELSLRRTPTYCHSLSIWGKVNPSGTLYKTVSDSIWVILNTPSVKLCKALKVSWLFAPANNRGMPWYYHRHLLYDHHASYVRSW